MKKIIFAFFILIIKSSFALTFSEEWSSQYTLNLKVQCNLNEDQLCNEICDGKSVLSLNNSGYSCLIPQTICRDCIGTSLRVSDIFENMGTKYKNNGSEVHYYTFIDFIKSRKFTTFSSQSVFNHVESYDAEILQQKFRSLCPINTKNRPLVFFSLLEKSNRLDQVVYVTCDTKIFEMTIEDLLEGSL